MAPISSPEKNFAYHGSANNNAPTAGARALRSSCGFDMGSDATYQGQAVLVETDTYFVVLSKVYIQHSQARTSRSRGRRFGGQKLYTDKLAHGERFSDPDLWA